VFSARWWLEISLHPEGPASGQLDQGFPWFSLVSEQMVSWYPNFTLFCMHAVKKYYITANAVLSSFIFVTLMEVLGSSETSITRVISVTFQKTAFFQKQCFMTMWCRYGTKSEIQFLCCNAVTCSFHRHIWTLSRPINRRCRRLVDPDNPVSCPTEKSATAQEAKVKLSSQQTVEARSLMRRRDPHSHR
jgi:hypothetical protein